MRQLRLDPSQLLGEDPLVIRGFVTPDSLNDEPYKSNYNPNEVRYRRGMDGRYRFSVNTMTYFFPLKSELAAFTGAVSALAQEARNEQGYTYFYDDIVGVATDRRQTRYKLSFSALGVLLGDPSVNVAFSLAVLPIVLSFGLTILAFRLENLAFAGFSGIILFLYPFILIGDLIWFFFFRQRNLQSQTFAVEVNNGSVIGAIVGFIAPRRISFISVPSAK